MQARDGMFVLLVYSLFCFSSSGNALRLLLLLGRFYRNEEQSPKELLD